MAGGRKGLRTMSAMDEMIVCEERSMLMNPLGAMETLVIKGLTGICLEISSATSLGAVEPADIRKSKGIPDMGRV